MKADDGGLGISYDRGLNWLYISDLPVSQYYRVSVDMARPYNVYGGLQDNGSWMGPSETYRQSGILNSDWTRLGGGDGFINLVDTTSNTIVYTESQYLGLSRVNMRTGERTSIRPGDPIGHIGGRRNWETWREVGTFDRQRLGNAMAPANWDGPFIISPHDASALYAGDEHSVEDDGPGRLVAGTGRPDDRHRAPHPADHGADAARPHSFAGRRDSVLAHHLGGGGESAGAGAAVCGDG